MMGTGTGATSTGGAEMIGAVGNWHLRKNWRLRRSWFVLMFRLIVAID